MTIQEALKGHKIICDGGFGTYYSTITGTNGLPEKANLENQELVKKTAHQEVHLALLINVFQHSTAVVWICASIHGFRGHKIRKSRAEGCDHNICGKRHIFKSCVSDSHCYTSLMCLIANHPVK